MDSVEQRFLGSGQLTASEEKLQYSHPEVIIALILSEVSVLMSQIGDTIQPLQMVLIILTECLIRVLDLIILPSVTGSVSNSKLLPLSACSPLLRPSLCSGLASHSSARGLDKWN